VVICLILGKKKDDEEDKAPSYEELKESFTEKTLLLLQQIN